MVDKLDKGSKETKEDLLQPTDSRDREENVDGDWDAIIIKEVIVIISHTLENRIGLNTDAGMVTNVQEKTAGTLILMTMTMNMLQITNKEIRFKEETITNSLQEEIILSKTSKYRTNKANRMVQGT